VSSYVSGRRFRSLGYFDLSDDLTFLIEDDGKAAISFYQMKAYAAEPQTAWPAGLLRATYQSR
jgi:hypothetical protein